MFFILHHVAKACVNTLFCPIISLNKLDWQVVAQTNGWKFGLGQSTLGKKPAAVPCWKQQFHLNTLKLSNIGQMIRDCLGAPGSAGIGLDTLPVSICPQ